METPSCEVCRRAEAVGRDPCSGRLCCGRVCQTAVAGLVAPDSTDCEARLAHYHWEAHLGGGSFGDVHRVFNRVSRAHTALKVQRYSGAADDWRGDDETRVDAEIVMACRLSAIAGFVETRDYWVCVATEPEPLRIWLTGRPFPVPRRLAFIEMQQADGTLQDLLENPAAVPAHQRLIFFFELIFALNLAWTRWRFVHHDLAARNILWLGQQPVRHYRVGDARFETDAHFRPLLSDFGEAELAEEEEEEVPEEELRDLDRVADYWEVTLFREPDRMRDPPSDWRAVRGGRDYTPLLSLLLERIVEAQ